MRRTTSDALEIIDHMIANDPKVRAFIEEARVNLDVAQLIYDAHTQAGLTQKQLAELAGRSQPVIARLEDGDYNRHSLSTLQRIAYALGQQVEVRFKPLPGKKGRKPS